MIKTQYYFKKVLKRLNQGRVCAIPTLFDSQVHTSLKAINSEDLKSEAYHIYVNEKGIEIHYGDYSGYVYALETLSQLVKNGEISYC